MANNRMFLVYKPTGDAVCLGKRMADGWYDVPETLGAALQKLFNLVEHVGPLDAFALAMEDGWDNPHIVDDWKECKRSPVEGLHQLVGGEFLPTVAKEPEEA